MCAALIANARIRRIYFAPQTLNQVEFSRVQEFLIINKRTTSEIYSGIGEEKAAKLLRNFFAKKRLKA